mmetsp:Transcript_138815/g.387116  ORF Transcript_138815/g.387116 Transcript_138815/m.387116 type:complete len:207 (-) Transcript_138815:84-704(-)
MTASSIANSAASPSATFNSRTQRWKAPSLGRRPASRLRISPNKRNTSGQRTRWPSIQVTRKAGEAFSSWRWASTSGCNAALSGLHALEANSSGLVASSRNVHVALPSSAPLGSSLGPTAEAAMAACGRLVEPVEPPRPPTRTVAWAPAPMPAATSATFAALASSSYLVARAAMSGRVASSRASRTSLAPPCGCKPSHLTARRARPR